MCGSYVRRSDKQEIAEWFQADAGPDSLPMPDAHYDIAPTVSQPILRQSRETGHREIILGVGSDPFLYEKLERSKGPFNHQRAGRDHRDSEDLA